MDTSSWELIAWVKDPKAVEPVKKGIVMLCVEDTPDRKWALFIPNPDGEWMIKSSGQGDAYAIKRHN